MAIARPHQLRADAGALAGAPHAAVHHVLDAELARQRARRHRALAERQHLGAARHRDAFETREVDDQILDQAGGDERVVGFGAEDVEIEHRDARRRPRPGCGRRLLERGAAAREIGDQVLGARVAVGRILAQQLQHQIIEIGCHFRPQAARRRRSLVENAVRHRLERRALERLLAGQRLIEQAAERPEIRAIVGRQTLELLGTHRQRRAERHAGRREARRSLDGRHAEIEHLRAVRTQHHVRRLEIAMDDAERVDFCQAIGEIARQLHRFVHRQRSALQALLQRFAFDPLHDEERSALEHAGLVHRHHCGMIDARRRLRFAQQAVH